MTTIITDSFLKARERTIVTELTHEAWSIGEMLGEKSNRVQAILDSREPIVVVSADVLYETLIQEAFWRVREQMPEPSHEDLLALSYICKLIAELISGELTESHQEMQQHPYVQDFIVREDFKTAGDTALYGFWFLVGKRHNRLSYKDYIHLAVQSYLRWFEKAPLSIGYILAERVQSFLPAIDDLPRKIFGDVKPRAQLSLVSSQGN
jgi:hypothetical protein